MGVEMKRLATALVLGTLGMAAMGVHALETGMVYPPRGSVPLHTPSRIAYALDDNHAATSLYQWPGVYFEGNFAGQYVTVKLNDTVNKLAIYVDGNRVRDLVRPGNIAVRLGPYSDGQHTIRLEKLSETQAGVANFIGFFPDSPHPSTLPSLARNKRIEFIGDSYTAGYGNTSLKHDCTKEEIWATTDSQQAFGPLTAKHYDADYQINAYSGIGIVRNYDGVAPGHVMPKLYPMGTFDQKDGDSRYYGNWDPQIVVIALGGNDFSTPVHAGDKWATLEDLRADFIASYVAFVKQVRANHPKAQFILLDYGEDEVGKDVAEVIKRLNADGETRVMPFSTGGGFEQTGCDWHLSTNDDKRISASLITFIDAHPDLWNGQ